MRLGIVSDIHCNIASLDMALDRIRGTQSGEVMFDVYDDPVHKPHNVKP